MDDDPYYEAIKGLVDIDEILAALLEVHHQFNDLNLPVNRWINLEQCYPPYNNRKVVTYCESGDSYELHDSSHYLVQHLLLDKYYYQHIYKISFRNITQFMVLGDTNGNP